jgi:hypothetical protein
MAFSNLGKFGELPREIRDEIWKHFRPQQASNDNSVSQLSNLYISRACRQLSEEVSPHLYNKEVLTFVVSPLYERQSWINVTSDLGATWSLESLFHATALGFATLPYERLKGIKINIQAL